MDFIKLEKAREIIRYDCGSRDWIRQYKTPATFTGRESALAAAEDWLRQPQYPPLRRFLWINGALGSGKSAIVTEIIKRIENEHLGDVDVYFCEASTSDTRYAGAIIKFIASYLSNACGDGYYSDDLTSFICNDAFSSANAQQLFPRLIALPTSRIKSDKNVYVVIDALDEMLPDECQAFLTLLSRFNPPQWLRIILTSRDELQIRRNLSACSQCISLNDSESNNADVREYFKAALPDRNEKYIDVLVEKSQGNFLYAVKLCEEITSYGDIDLDEIPLGLYSLYDSMLERKYENDGEFDRDAKEIFEILVAAKSPVSISDIAAVLGKSVAEINKRMQKISSFVISHIARTGAEEVRIYNPSFTDYLTKSNDNIYYIDKKNGETALLKYISQNEGAILQSKYFKRYALTHIVESNNSALLRQLLTSQTEKLPDKIENDLYYVYLTNGSGVIKTLEKLPSDIIRRILLTTYRKGLSHGLNTSEEKDGMQNIIELLRGKGEGIRATMLEGERLQRMKNYPAAEEKFLQCLSLAEDYDKQQKTSWSKRYIALVYNRLGNLAGESKCTDYAAVSRGYYAKGYELFRRIVEMQDEYWQDKETRLIYIKDLAISTARMGDLQIKSVKPDYAEVIKHYEEYNKYCRQLSDEGNRAIKHLRELATSFRRLGDAYMFTDAAKAYNMYISSLKILQEIVETCPTDNCPALRQDTVCFADGEGSGSTAEEGFAILPYEHREPDYSREHALCFMRLAAAAHYCKNSALAGEWAARAVESCTKLNNSRGTVESASDLKTAEFWQDTIKGVNLL